MPQVTFRLANGVNTSDSLLFSMGVEIPVPDEWLQAAQDYFAANLPPGITWTTVHKFSMQVQELREIDPSQ